MSEVSVLVFYTFMCISMLLVDFNVQVNNRIIAKASVSITDSPTMCFHSLFCVYTLHGI